MLKANGLWSVVTGIETLPAISKGDEKSAFEQKESKAFVLICSCLAPSYFGSFRRDERVVGAWKNFCAVYQQNSLDIVLMGRKAFHTVSMKGSMADYIMKVRLP